MWIGAFPICWQNNGVPGKLIPDASVHNTWWGGRVSRKQCKQSNISQGMLPDSPYGFAAPSVVACVREKDFVDTPLRPVFFSRGGGGLA